MDIDAIVAALKPIVLIAGVAVFVGIVAYAFWPGRKREIEARGQIPLKED
jgi:cbb3-type cytochrome oxidase subunit 3